MIHMLSNEIATLLVRMPREIRRSASLTVRQYLDSLDYNEHRDQISQECIQRALLEDKEAIDSWLEYSESKRSSVGWFFRRSANDHFEIGIYDSNKGYSRVSEYDTSIDACSLYIINEVGSILDGL